MIISNLPTESNLTAQLMMIKRRAHHEDRLIHSRPLIDNKLKDFSHILKPEFSSKKKYLSKQNKKEIHNGNTNLLSKIYSINFERQDDAAKYSTVPRRVKKEDNLSLAVHPYASDHRTRSLNTQSRRKELERINKDNSQFLGKLRTIKSIVPTVKDSKARDKEINYLKNLRQKQGEDKQVKLLKNYIQKLRGDAVLSQFMVRHDLLDARSFVTHNDSTVSSKDKSPINFDFARKLVMDESENAFDDSRDIVHTHNNSDIITGSKDFERKMVSTAPIGRKGARVKRAKPGHSKKNREAYEDLVKREYESMEKIDTEDVERVDQKELDFKIEAVKLERSYL